VSRARRSAGSLAAPRAAGTLRTAFAIVAALLTFAAVSARATTPTIYIVHIEGVINPILARYVRRSFDVAESKPGSVVLLAINTPGGLVSSMQEIVADITNAKVPVIGLVTPRSAQATSAGAFILLATDVAAMLPDTRTGAAHPVGAGENLQGAMEAKATNSLASFARSLASRRGRSEKVAESIVRDSRSLTANEAKDEKLVDLVVTSTDDLLAKLDGTKLDFPDRHATFATRGAARVDLPMSVADRFLDSLADPTLASILLSIGVLGIIYELSAPGVGLGGTVGVVALLLALLSMSILPVELAGALLLVAGFVAIGIEIKVPSHGLIGVGGALAIGLGAIVLIDEARYFGAVQRIDWRIFAPIVAVLALLFVSVATIARRALRAPPQSGVEALIGAQGTAKETFLPQGELFSGSAFVDGARWNAIADAAILEGDAVRVLEVLAHPGRLRVKRIEKGES
jgi:membrane-bound serine protease (ClpP class)